MDTFDRSFPENNLFEAPADFTENEICKDDNQCKYFDGLSSELDFDVHLRRGLAAASRHDRGMPYRYKTHANAGRTWAPVC